MKRILIAILFDILCILFMVAGLSILFSFNSPFTNSILSNIVNNFHGFGASLLDAVPFLQGFPPVSGLFFIILGVIWGFISLRILSARKVKNL